jgi:transposase-like protein
MEMAEKKVPKSPEVLEKASRRRYTREYKEKMVAEADRCSASGELGALLRREGLYTGAINRWRTEIQESTLSSAKKPKSSTKKPKRKETPSQEIARLKQQNARLAEKLRRAELIIDVQKKVSEMIQTRSLEKDD